MRVSNFLFAGLLILSGCDDLSFTDVETQGGGLVDIKKTGKEPLDDSGKDTVQPEKSQPTENESPDAISEEETTLISEDMELAKNTVIQNRRVVLNMITIKTFEYDLFVLAEEFVSHHSVIQNFPEGQKAERKHNGKNGGNILIETKMAQGELQLILNGEDAGPVPTFEILSNNERSKLKGHDGENGYNAVYREYRKNKGAFFSK